MVAFFRNSGFGMAMLSLRVFFLTSMKEIKPIAMPGTHQAFLKFFLRKEPAPVRILDVGAGYGAFTQKLHGLGYDVHACDLFPEIFEYEALPCNKVDVTLPFPYPDKAFDVVIAVEVSEHVPDHENFFGEVNRILRSGGRFYLSTPNILSLKSRVRFLSTGYFYSFRKLDYYRTDGLQHVASLTPDQYNFIATRAGFEVSLPEIDRRQSTSRWLWFLLYPMLRVQALFGRGGSFHNQKSLLLGRLLFLSFHKPV